MKTTSDSEDRPGPAQEATTTVLLIRHGQTEWNALGLVQGHTNSQLTSLGRRQARALTNLIVDAPPILAPYMLGDRPQALYTSDLGRTQETAQPLAATLALDAVAEPALREMNFGELEGLRWSEVEASYPDVARQLWGPEADPAARAPGGESRMDMHTRSLAAIKDIAVRHAGNTVAVVSHGGVISYFMRSVLGVPPEHRPGFSTPNGAIAAFRFKEDRFKMLCWGLVPTVAGE